ncbi:Uncharacterised protein [Actinobacillus equuli]|nr:Uncharacterised protein [Actinobacillus equuli]
MKTAFAEKAVAFLRIFANKIVEVSRQLQDFLTTDHLGLPCIRFLCARSFVVVHVLL